MAIVDAAFFDQPKLGESVFLPVATSISPWRHGVANAES